MNQKLASGRRKPSGAFDGDSLFDISQVIEVSEVTQTMGR
jgi:hypothetical protein